MEFGKLSLSTRLLARLGGDGQAAGQRKKNLET
jgi:hypothetical protein